MHANPSGWSTSGWPDARGPGELGRRHAHVLGDKENGLGTLKQVVFEKLATWIAVVERLDPRE